MIDKVKCRSLGFVDAFGQRERKICAAVDAIEVERTCGLSVKAVNRMKILGLPDKKTGR